jgi:hypothetical protein
VRARLFLRGVQCRLPDSDQLPGAAIKVEHLVDVTVGAIAATLTIHPLCKTRMGNDGTSPTSFVNDSRDWTTVITF